MTSPVEAGARFRRAARALAPDRALIVAVELTHPAAPGPARAVADTAPRVIEGNSWPALRFGLRLADDADDRPPRAELQLDNVGRVLTDWIEASRGAAGAKARILQLSVDPATDAAEVEWEQTLAIQEVRVDRSRVTAVLGVPSLRGRVSVVARHDPRRSPGLFG